MISSSFGGLTFFPAANVKVHDEPCVPKADEKVIVAAPDPAVEALPVVSVMLPALSVELALTAQPGEPPLPRPVQEPTVGALPPPT